MKKHLLAGYLLTCIGDKGQFSYKKSRRGNTPADTAAEVVLRDLGGYRTLDFNPADGSDDRQYGSPGFDLPLGSVMRTMYGSYPEYHTSLDNKSVISFAGMVGAVDACVEIVKALESNRVWKNTVMRGEPQLGKRDLYSDLADQQSLEERTVAILWLLNLADGTRDLVSIAKQSGQKMSALTAASVELARAGLIERVDR